jgi:O-antigen ligase
MSPRSPVALLLSAIGWIVGASVITPFLLPPAPAYRTTVVAAALLLFALGLVARRLSFVLAVLTVTVAGVSALVFGFAEPIAAGAVAVSGYFAGALIRSIYEVGEAQPFAPLLSSWWALFVGSAVSAVASIVQARSAYLLFRGVPPPRAVNVLGTDASQAVAGTLSALAVLAVAAGFYQAASWLSRTRSGERTTDVALVLSALTAGGVALAQKLGALPLWRSARWAEWSRVQSTFTDPSAAGVGAALLLAPLLARTATGQFPLRLASAAGAVLLVGVVTDAGSRAGLIEMLTSAVLFLLWALIRLAAGERPGVRRGVVRVIGGISLLVALAFAVSLSLPQRGGVRSALMARLEGSFSRIPTPSETASGRLILYEAAAITFRNHPIVGTGLGSFLYDFPNVAAESLERPVRATDYPPSYYLGVLAEMGLAGAFLLSLLLIGLIRGIAAAFAFHEAHTGTALRAAGAAAALAGLLVVFLFGSHMVYPEIAAFTGILSARLKIPPEGRTQRLLVALVPVVLAGTLVLLMGSVLGHVFQTLDSKPAFAYEPTAGLFPVEREPDGRPFRWSSSAAAMPIELPSGGGGVLSVPIRNARPDRALVMVDVLWDDRLRGRVAIPFGGWHRLEIPVETPGVLRLVPSSTFRPLRGPDRRHLGVELGERVFLRTRPS